MVAHCLQAHNHKWTFMSNLFNINTTEFITYYAGEFTPLRGAALRVRRGDAAAGPGRIIYRICESSMI